MGHEKSAPHIKTIVIIAGVCVVTLALLEWGFKSYYNAMFEDEESAKVLTVKPAQLNALREGEAQHLTSGKMPLDKAMRELAARGRDNPTLKELGTDLTPLQSTEPVPVWALLAKDAGALAPAASAATGSADAGPGAVALVAGDAGAARIAVDGGATHASDAATTPAVKEAGTH